MPFSSHAAVLSLTASTFAFSTTSGAGLIHSAYGSNATETDASGISFEEASYIFLGFCALFIVVVGYIRFKRMRENTERFARQNALFDRFRARDERLSPHSAPYELQLWPLATQAEERKTRGP